MPSRCSPNLCSIGLGFGKRRKLTWPEIQVWTTTATWRWSQGLSSSIHVVTQKHQLPTLDFLLVYQAWGNTHRQALSSTSLKQGWLWGNGPCCMMASPLSSSFIFVQQLGTDGSRVYTIGVEIKARASLTLHGRPKAYESCHFTRQWTVAFCFL